jgi:uncharacterized protein YndB with AHSA1/START domain
MDVRPGGLWRHVMHFPSGHELHFNFVFLEVEKPNRLVWQHVDHGRGKRDPLPPHPVAQILESNGERSPRRLYRGALRRGEAQVKISMHTMAADSFVPILESLSAILDKGDGRACKVPSTRLPLS